MGVVLQSRIVEAAGDLHILSTSFSLGSLPPAQTQPIISARIYPLDTPFDAGFGLVTLWRNVEQGDKRIHMESVHFT